MVRSNHSTRSRAGVDAPGVVAPSSVRSELAFRIIDVEIERSQSVNDEREMAVASGPIVVSLGRSSRGEGPTHRCVHRLCADNEGSIGYALNLSAAPRNAAALTHPP